LLLRWHALLTCLRDGPEQRPDVESGDRPLVITARLLLFRFFVKLDPTSGT
jgi:hypothetical protein